MIRSFFAAAAVGVVLALTSGCQPTNAFVPPPPAEVTVAQPLKRDVVDYFQTTGETRAVNRVELRAQVSGYLKEINFKDGELVEAGRVLFVVDPHRYKAALNSANAQLQKAEAQLTLTTAQLRRIEGLVEKGSAATKSQLDEARAQKASAEADVSSAKSAINRANLDVGFTEIRAPFAGRMGRHQVDVGNLVEVGTTLLATIETVDPIHAYFNLSEADLLRFMNSPGQASLATGETGETADGPEIELALGEGMEYQFKGRLDFQEFGVDPATGTTLRRAVFQNSDERLVPGLFVRVRTAVGPPQPKLLVEERAISSDQRGDFLLVVAEKKVEPPAEGAPAAAGAAAPAQGAPAPGAPPAGSKPAGGAGTEPGVKHVVEQRRVRLGRSDAGLRVIEEGLKGDEWIVINGLQRARPNAEVRPQKTEMAEPIAGQPVAFRVLPSGTAVADKTGGAKATE